MRLRRAGLGVLTVLGLTLPLTSAGTVAPANGADPAPHVLYAGQKLIYQGDYGAAGSILKAGEFTLFVGADNVSLEQVITLTGKNGSTTAETGVWFADDGTGEHQVNHDRTALTMHRDGNLVLTASNGDTLWTSRTSGTGRYNRLVLSPTGNLAIFTHTNKLVWSSRSSAVLLPPGRALPSGASMRDAYEPPGHYVAQTLRMQADGNLVRRCNDNVLWQSGTHAPGSRLQMTSNGGLAIITRSNHVVWHANVTVHTTYAFFSKSNVEIDRADGIETVWAAKNVGYRCN